MRFALRLGSFGTGCARSDLILALARWQRCLRSAPPLRLAPCVARPEATLRTRSVCQRKASRLPTKLPLWLALLLWAPLAVAQSNVGALLDAGAKKLTTEEFRQELVQRVIVGPTPSGGGNLELMYANNGVIQGVGTQPPFMNTPQQIRGEWKIDDSGKICTSMSILTVILPYRCQFWFKYDAEYFLADSDSDRSARVLRRTVKQ
jgi:hypothetical protein